MRSTDNQFGQVMERISSYRAALLLVIITISEVQSHVKKFDEDKWRYETLLDSVPSAFRKNYDPANHQCSAADCFDVQSDGKLSVNDFIHRNGFSAFYKARLTRNADTIMASIPKLKHNDVIFVDGDMLWNFFFNNLIRVQMNFILVTHHPHYTTPQGCNILTGDCLPPLVRELGTINRVVRIFGPNWVTELGNQKIFGMPSGVSDEAYANRGKYFDAASCASPFGSQKRKTKVLVPLVAGREYEIVLRYLRKSSLSSKDINEMRTGEYPAQLANSQFITIRTVPEEDPTLLWEALYLGVIPIMLSISCENPLYNNIPLVCVKEWDEITTDLLDKEIARWNKVSQTKSLSCYPVSHCTTTPLCIPRVGQLSYWIAAIENVRQKLPSADIPPYFNPKAVHSAIPNDITQLDDANLIYFYIHTKSEMSFHYWRGMNFSGLPPYVCPALHHLACVSKPNYHQTLKRNITYGKVNVFFITNHPESVYACLRTIELPELMKFHVISTSSDRRMRMFASEWLNSYRRTHLYNAWDGLWKFAMERFFFVERLMWKYYVKHVFLIETDNLLYVHPSVLATAMRFKYGPATVASPQREYSSVSGLMYVGAVETIQRLCQFLLRWSQTGTEAGFRFIGNADIYGSGEMIALRMYQFLHGPSALPHVSTVPPNLTVHTHLYDNVPVLDLSSLWDCSKDPHSSCSCLVFDDATYGIFLGGTPNFEKPGTIIEGHTVGPHIRDHRLLVSWDPGTCVQGLMCSPIVSRMRPKPYKRCLVANLHVHKKHVIDLFVSPLCPIND